MPESQRRSTGELLVALAASDGSIAPAEMDLLAWLFDLLGLEKSGAYSQAHALSDETLTRMRTEGARRRITPSRQAAAEVSRNVGAVVLDPELIKARLAESARAASYLAEIFTEDDVAAEVTAATSGQSGTVVADSQVAGLDAAHNALPSRLADRLGPTVQMVAPATGLAS